MVSVALRVWMSSAFIVMAGLISPAQAHEILPAIADMTEVAGRLEFQMRLDIEGLTADLDVSQSASDSEQSALSYDTLRLLGPGDLADRFTEYWPQMATLIAVDAGTGNLPLVLTSVEVPEIGDTELTRMSLIAFHVILPRGANSVEFSWDAQFGALVLRQQGVDAPYDGYLDFGESSGPIHLTGGDQVSPLEGFIRYIPVGFDHIVPKGLDHILFVLGLFFLASTLRPLLWQVSTFTVAHTITLAAAALGYVNVPGNIVEPLIAASIVFIAVENLLSKGVSSWRLVVIFCFGLLHGLGFASVLGEFGLPDEAFVPALIGFNVGVELGQLAVILTAFVLIGFWFRDKPWYRARISMPASVLIGAVGAWWFIERTIL
jgi:hydrogenase/urease accessory protein HupE